jgi:hypothetical protein
LLLTFRTRCLQDRRELEGSTRFPARNRKNRCNIGLSEARARSREEANSHARDQSIESI